MIYSEMMDNKTKTLKDILKTELFKYGFVPLLIVLEKMEEVGNYGICQAIVDVIKEQNNNYSLELPTRLNGEAIAQMKINFMTYFNLSGDIADSNKYYYAYEIMKVLKSENII